MVTQMSWRQAIYLVQSKTMVIRMLKELSENFDSIK